MQRDRVRTVATAAALPSLVGITLFVSANDFGVVMAWILIPMILSGLVLSRRFYPLGFLSASAGAANEGMNQAWKRSFADIGRLTALVVALLFIAAVVIQFVDTDLSAFLAALLIAIAAAGGLMLGLLAGLLTVVPLVTLAVAAGRVVTRHPVDAERTAGAALLLSLAVFATSAITATSIQSSGSSRGDGWVAIFVVLTGAQGDDARIVSEPLAWAARISLMVLVGSVVWLARLQRRRTTAK